MIKIEQIKNISQKDYEACLKILPQLLATATLPTYQEFLEITNSPTTCFFVARQSDLEEIFGMLTLILYRIPVGLCARIEDVIVDEEHRRKGIGKMLCQTAIDTAKKAKAMKIDLTSNPSRQEAHRLYESLGFSVYDTNVYRLQLKNSQK